MADSTVPPTTLDLAWKGGSRFTGRSEGVDLTFDGPGNPTPTPVQALAGSLAACMGIDLVQILGKGRHEVLELRVRLSGDRREEYPRHFTAIRLHFTLRGAIPPEAVERAIQLSRESYCSVWHSLRQDIALTTTFELLPPAKA